MRKVVIEDAEPPKLLPSRPVFLAAWGGTGMTVLRTFWRNILRCLLALHWLELALHLALPYTSRVNTLLDSFFKHGPSNEEVRNEVCHEVNEEGGKANVDEEDCDEEEGSQQDCAGQASKGCSLPWQEGEDCIRAFSI